MKKSNPRRTRFMCELVYILAYIFFQCTSFICCSSCQSMLQLLDLDFISVSLLFSAPTSVWHLWPINHLMAGTGWVFVGSSSWGSWCGWAWVWVLGLGDIPASTASPPPAHVSIFVRNAAAVSSTQTLSIIHIRFRFLWVLVCCSASCSNFVVHFCPTRETNKLLVV